MQTNKQKITYCLMALNNLHEVIRCIERVKPYVDRVIVVDGGSIDDTIVTLRNWKSIELYIHPWEDSFSKQRNNYVKHALEDPRSDWMIVSDPDELFSEDACKNFRILAETAGAYNAIAFRAESVYINGPIINRSQVKNYWKALMFRLVDGSHYTGNPHETYNMPGGVSEKRVEHKYYHIKQEGVVWIRATRNVFIGGGGKNLGKDHPLWIDFRRLVKEKTGIDTWRDFNKYLVDGNIDSEIKDQLCKFKEEDGYDGAEEWRQMYKTYFELYHPEERK